MLFCQMQIIFYGQVRVCKLLCFLGECDIIVLYTDAGNSNGEIPKKNPLFLMPGSSKKSMRSWSNTNDEHGLKGGGFMVMSHKPLIGSLGDSGEGGIIVVVDDNRSAGA